MRVLPARHRQLFKEPFGTLFLSFEEVLIQLPGKRVFSVGDVVTAHLLTAGRPPDVAVVDGHTMRQPYPGVKIPEYHQILVKNPPGGLTEELIEASAIAAGQPGTVIQVEGEEDLAVVPLAMHAPLGTIILYGQPGEGVVMLAITQDMKKRAEELFMCFEEVSTSSAREVFNI
ncbi:DUF359 domain-containing protein [Methanospirillum sp. J.3.6.1-F.2.7.3]|jgi:uncharacterized protein (UPF0218 family)|uniref:GTP-dependent dephospho-CoA kinase n=1 Tax=Methanospirillum purgamenti TaxID=2834276 RepID=A0A8E7EHK9_9EURY|nr:MULTISPECIES: DUF359 domain-containing protein [Methanospirillum]MDX8549258.1 DUF359 domain-containing protein [Methanospirillum hungatei]NLW76010.1 DUF359 domain-containing protein [Methanomicrobiales archaeon]QVV89443.1 DUF359 domain-containing protein [Methanospirillum sp. J.3.6.1-F.2.7.3]